MAGITTTGFDVKTVDQILASFEAVELAQISTSLDMQPTALTGVLNGLVAQALSELWLLALSLYNGMNPDRATGDQQTSLALLTGTLRRKASPTEVLAVNVVVGAGFIAQPRTMIASINGNPTAQFTNKALVDNSGGITQQTK